MTEAILVAMLAFLLGGVLKGAIGAGTPVVAGSLSGRPRRLRTAR